MLNKKRAKLVTVEEYCCQNVQKVIAALRQDDIRLTISCYAGLG